MCPCSLPPDDRVARNYDTYAKEEEAGRIPVESSRSAECGLLCHTEGLGSDYAFNPCLAAIHRAGRRASLEVGFSLPYVAKGKDYTRRRIT